MAIPKDAIDTILAKASGKGDKPKPDAMAEEDGEEGYDETAGPRASVSKLVKALGLDPATVDMEAATAALKEAIANCSE